ncbi:kinase-like domain-containing protein [Butyriboletus roseoflavus]|nr:kinase-like domain-containing protein [Butyriboletus roseoflavus]
MLYLLRHGLATPTLKLCSPSHQYSPYSPYAYAKRTTFTAALADASNSPADPATQSDRLPVVIHHPKEVQFLTRTVETRRLPLLTRPLPVCDIDSGTENNSTAIQDTSHNPIPGHSSFTPTANLPCSSFPVYGPFDLLHCLQTGGFGAAWAAKDQSTGQLLCLKIFRSLRDPDVARSVQTELRIFRRMVKSKEGERGKQFIMELNRSIQHDTTVLFAMELMTTDLGTYMFTEPERCKLHARRWTAQIALGIESLHEMGILHRDIKADNILVDCRENIRIIDFGLAYLEPTGKPLRQGVEYAIDFTGTPPFMAPEILRNEGKQGHRWKRYGTAVDWWGLGCILFELESLDHQILFDSINDVRAYVAWTQRPCQLEEETYPRFEGLDPVVLGLVEGLLQVNPSVRYSLNDLEKHDYFLLCDGRSEFDITVAQALERPICPELVPQFTGDHGPIQVIEAAKLSLVYDWTNIKWAWWMTKGKNEMVVCY